MNSVDLEAVSSSSSAKRVLVTGATGFIGQHCLDYLVNEGFEVHAMSRSSHKIGVDDDGVHWYLNDLFNSGSQENIVNEVDDQIYRTCSNKLHGRFYCYRVCDLAKHRV